MKKSSPLEIRAPLVLSPTLRTDRFETRHRPASIQNQVGFSLPDLLKDGAEIVLGLGYTSLLHRASIALRAFTPSAAALSFEIQYAVRNPPSSPASDHRSFRPEPRYGDAMDHEGVPC